MRSSISASPGNGDVSSSAASTGAYGVAPVEPLGFPSTDQVPEVALFSPEGRSLRVDEPGRFRGARIAAVLATYRDAASRLVG
jgi:hypothetical protein